LRETNVTDSGSNILQAARDKNKVLQGMKNIDKVAFKRRIDNFSSQLKVQDSK